MAGIKKGNLAPVFTLPDHTGAPVNLKDLRGQTVVLYFYPKAMTPGCTVQACALRDHQADLTAAGAVVLGISPDPVKKLAKFVDKEGLNFRLLADEDHSVAERYGAWGLKKFMGREYMGVLRTTYIIDADGRIAHVLSDVNTKTHHADVLARLRGQAE